MYGSTQDPLSSDIPKELSQLLPIDEDLNNDEQRPPITYVPQLPFLPKYTAEEHYTKELS